MKDLENTAGRWFTKSQLDTATRQEAVPIGPDKQACVRCGTAFSQEHRLPDGAYYCRECIMLGRVRSDEALYAVPQRSFPQQHSLSWQGSLTSAQAKISQALCHNITRKQATLVHAVTGAGKTEMIYAAIASVLDQGGAVCLASPRIDVCVELHKRLQGDFSCPLVLLHGEAAPYERAPLVIATTHQLLKFYQAFDLLIVDEVDAFPYVDNPILYRAVQQAVKPDGVPVYLTATPTENLEKKIRKGELACLRLPKRFHGHPLVVPRKIRIPSLQKSLEKRKLPSQIRQFIDQQRQTGYPLLLFAPEIQMGQKIATILQEDYPQERIGFVSSQTENRLELVEQFRQGKISILVATTILERGVTFPCVDVYVLGANHFLYTKSSLVQIAGRAGRSLQRPSGEVLYFIEENTRAIQKSIQEICQMNQEAGYV